MIGLVMLVVASLAFILGAFVGHRTDTPCHVGSCAAKATRCEGHR